MNVYITKLNGMSPMSTGQYIQHMTADIAHTLGIREMGIYRYRADGESAENRARRLDGIIAGINAGDIVVCQFPTGNGLEFDRTLVRHIKAYHGQIVMFIHNPEAMMAENPEETLPDAIRLYNEAEVLIVPSCRVKQFLVNQGIRAGMKFVIWELRDYTTQLNSLDLGKPERKLHFAGNPDRFPFLHTWDYEIPLNVYSNQECRGKHVQRMGWMPSDRLLLELSGGGFGLVWYGNEYGRRYLSANSSLKLSAYLAAGIPVIVPRGISNQCMIEENHLGIVTDTLNEAAEAVKSVTEQEYREYTAAVSRFAPLLRQGFFAKKCLVDALQTAMRKDMYTYFESNVVCAMPKREFEYVCLNESYGGNLALSWTFRGEAEGFLIYDADSERLLGEVCDGLGHYLLLKNQPKGIRLIVRAYVRAVRGKMVIAESDVTYVKEKHPGKSLVSMVIPAYNAAEFIARSMDTVLAQSFMELELIVVNDGSIDETQEIIDWYKERYPRIKGLYQKNAGQAVARNLGVEYADGDYISFMDSDDMIRPDMIEKLYDSIVKNNCDIAMTSAYQVTNEGYGVVSAYPIAEDTPVPFDEFFEHYLRYAYPVVWGKLYRRPLVKEHPIPKTTYEDSAWMPCILSYADKVCYLNERLYEYDRIIRNVTYVHTARRKSVEEQYEDRRDYVLFFLKNGNPKRMDMLKRLAMGYATGFVNSFSYFKFKELKAEIEQFHNNSGGI
ncbi:glycosyltransferase [Lachnospiraceae bacterium 45-P1]